MLNEIAKNPVRGKLLVAVAGLALLLPGLRALPLIDRDEPRFAGATLEMIQRHEWIIPYFNGEYRFDKPVLTYWLMRAGYALCGVGEVGARAHSVMSAVAIALMLFAMGQRWFTARAGLFAALGFLSCLQVLIHGRSAVADMPMVLAVTAVQWALAELLGLGPPQEGKNCPARAWFWVMYVALGLGFLAKGPIAWAVPALALILFRFALCRRPLPWRNLHLFEGVPIALAIVAAWGVPALLLTHGEFWSVGIGKHVVDRGTEAFHHRTFTPLYYVLALVPSLYPWSAYLPAAWRQFRAGPQALTAFLLAWFIAPYVIFTFYATQLPHYVLPGFPAFFLLLGAAADRADRSIDARPAWRRLVLTLGAVLGVALLFAAWRADWPASLDGLRRAAAGGGLMALGLTFLGWTARRRMLLAPVAVIVVGIGAQTLGIGLREVTPAIRLQRIFREMPPTARFACYRYREPSLVFYSRHTWQPLGQPEEIAAFLARPGPALLVLQESAGKPRGLALKERPEKFTVTAEQRAGWRNLELTGWNVARSEAPRLRVLYRTD